MKSTDNLSYQEPASITATEVTADIASLIEHCLSNNSHQSFDQWVSEWVYEQTIKFKSRSPDQVRYLAQQAVLSINETINRQLDQILHHASFQALEATWRGLAYLTDIEADYDDNLTVKIKILNASWKELGKDVTRAIEFDQSSLFKRIYSDEFDTPGGEPFGVILGDYTVTHRPRRGATFTDVDVLRHVADVATAALCPFITGVDPSLFGVNSLRELGYPINLASVFEQTEYHAWNNLRAYEGTRFLGLTLPNVLMRQPYNDDHSRREDFSYQERTDHPDKDFLWGNACFAFGSTLIRAFSNTGWFADIRGGIHEFGEGGVVRHLQYTQHRFEKHNVSARPAANIQVDDFLERELSGLGFIPLCSYHSVENSVFYSNNSLHESQEYTSEVATANARLSAMIQYMMCVSRFGHYVKVIGRDKIGSFVGAEECQRIFQNWLNQYTTANDTSSSALKARYPLSMSQVEVKDKVGSPGHYSCIMHLQPHFQLDQLVSSIKLVTELAIGTTSISN
ncbi:MAG: type VI secretion system contractile sheath large subunit [Cellvibrionaceae bacterium]|nr:type VI secretion system contractile sheath large subunit [Cellvibrionaceae bacterium]